MKYRGFTLIELIVVMGILAILATIVVIAVNPARQFAASRNAKRNNDVRAIQQALQQQAADNNGVLYAGITTTAQAIGTGVGKLDLTNILVPNYLSAIPTDPSGGTAADTKYVVYRDSNNAVGVSASQGELGGAIVAGNSPNLALQFDGVNDCVQLGVNKSLPSGTEFTYEFWFRMDGPNENYDTPIGLSANTWDFRLYSTSLTSATAHASSSSYGTEVSGFNVGDGNWHHVAVVFNSSAGWLRAYVDGVLRGSSGVTVGAVPTGFTPASTSWKIGCSHPGTRNVQATIDVVRISNVARYSSAFTPSITLDNDSNTVGLWNFSEGTGSTIRDASSVSNNGTTIDTQTWVVR